jgi:hypothetical protein
MGYTCLPAYFRPLTPLRAVFGRVPDGTDTGIWRVLKVLEPSGV